MNRSVVVSENDVARPNLPFDPTESFVSSVARFAEESGVKHVAQFDKFFEVDGDSVPGFFFQRVAFGKQPAVEPSFFAGGFHFQDGDRRFSFFVPGFENFMAKASFPV